MKRVRLNRLEIWVADHAAPVFLVVAALIVLGAGTTLYMWQKQGDTAEQVQVIAPQVTKVSRAICDQQSLAHSGRANRCAERIRVGLVNCRRVPRCRAALLALLTYPPPARGATLDPGATEGGGAQSPSPAGQQPGPGSQPGQPGKGGPGAAPAPSPAPAGPPAPAPSPSPGAGGSGAESAPSSDAGVEVCVKGVTCIEADLAPPDLQSKGTPNG